MAMTANSLRAALSDPNLRAFLAVIRAGEGTADDDGYRRMFGGELVNDLADHPRRAITKRLGGRTLTSTASGAYQFLSRTWDECAVALALPDFGPASQDLAAAFLIQRRRGLEHAIAGRLEQAIAACAREWANLPGSPYGQPVRTLAQCRAVYEAAGGQYADQAARAPDVAPTITSPDQPSGNFMEHVMALPAIIAAVLPSLIQAIPDLGRLFGSGSEVATRNVKAAEIAVDMVMQATGARNAQETAELVASDPALREAAQTAVRAGWLNLQDAGGGGIEGARKADAAAVASGGFWGSPSFWMGALLLPLVYMIVGNVIGLFGSAEWSPDARAGLAGSLSGAIIGGLVGYYYGQVTSRNRDSSAQLGGLPARD